MCQKLCSFIEVVVAFHQIAGAFYDTALLMVVHERSKLNSSTPNATTSGGQEDKQQDAVSQFYMIYNLLLGITPLFFTFSLAKLGDQKSRKITICVPLLGYLVSRSLLLFVILFHLPLEVMFGTAVLNGLSGGFTSYWTGVMALTSDISSEEKRSIRLIRVELTYGVAGMIGSIISGHIFIHFKISHYQGAVLVACSFILYAFSLLYSILGLKFSPEQTQPGSLGKEQFSSTTSLEHASLLDQGQHGNGLSVDQATDGDEVGQENASLNESQSETSRLLANQDNTRARDNPKVDKVTVALLFTAGVFYDLAVTGGVDVLSIFVLKAPMKWNAVWVGYGNAAGYATFLTSFLGVVVFSRCLKDTSLIVMGIVSFSTGILIMAFMKWTFLFFIARAVMMFALIPLPTIRSVISKQIEGTSYGKAFGVLQILLTLTGVIASTIFLKIYMSTQGWYPTLCFILSSIISCLSVIPIIIVERRLSEPSGYSRIPED
ncbi:solute carrier family 46 member 2 isoform X2 [Heptranchias perlo]|uniref:solute carrier family 46 member 2 isoform X2 n=1 Tax=Heptranchias perlo TaxID=212740 RepID=UPI00355A62D6